MRLIVAVTLLLAVVWGCGPREALPMAPMPDWPVPRYCGQAIRNGHEVVVLCSQTRETCEEAIRLARQFGTWYGLRRATRACFDRDKSVVTVETVDPLEIH